jgi:hypothetical protein
MDSDLCPPTDIWNCPQNLLSGFQPLQGGMLTKTQTANYSWGDSYQSAEDVCKLPNWQNFEQYIVISVYKNNSGTEHHAFYLECDF